jgi:hypothetical protein
VSGREYWRFGGKRFDRRDGDEVVEVADREGMEWTLVWCPAGAGELDVVFRVFADADLRKRSWVVRSSVYDKPHSGFGRGADAKHLYENHDEAYAWALSTARRFARDRKLIGRWNADGSFTWPGDL